jgi:hypothetical protein
MGWNTGYTIFESTVIGAYDLGKLDKELLLVLMEPYAGTDIDSGGSRDLKSKDGKDLYQIVIEAFGETYPTLDENASDDEKDEHLDEVYDLFSTITRSVGWD